MQMLTSKPKQTLRGFSRTVVLILIVAGLGAAGCQTIREVANLRKVQFHIDQVADLELAGVSLERVRSYQDLSATDVVRLTRAAASGEMPLTFTLMIEAENPADNNVQARLVDMDWTLLLDETETIAGRLEQNVPLPPGTPTTIPIPIELDLVRFFGDNARDLVELALALSGEGDPKTVTLRASPSIDTMLGPMRYPEPLTIVRREVGGEATSGAQ